SRRSCAGRTRRAGADSRVREPLSAAYTMLARLGCRRTVGYRNDVYDLENLRSPQYSESDENLCRGCPRKGLQKREVHRRDACSSAPVTANHLFSEPDMTKTMGATQEDGRLTVVSMSESPVGVAGKGAVRMLTVDTWPCDLLPFRQLTSARN